MKPAGTVIPLATDDVTTNRKIDVNDGVSKPMVSPKTGFAAGEQVSYWDFGLGKRNTSPAYGLMSCGAEGPVRLGHPAIVDSIPGDSDYSPFRAFQFACTTAKYAGQVIPSLDAFNDAIDLGLITDPTGTPATFWINQPIVTPDVALGGVANGAPSTAYYRGTAVSYHSFELQEGAFDIVAATPPATGFLPPNAGNVYELMKPGSTTPSRVVFSQPYRTPTGERNPLYSPQWIQVTVTLNRITMPGADAATLSAAYDAVLAKYTKESDLVTVGMNNALTVVNTAEIASAMVTTNRVNRPFVVNPGAM